MSLCRGSGLLVLLQGAQTGTLEGRLQQGTVEKNMETNIVRILGLHRDNGKETTIVSILGLYRDNGKETTLVSEYIRVI